MVAVGVKACEVVFCGGFFGADCVFVVFFGVVEEESCCGFGCELVGVFEGCFELLGVMGVGVISCRWFTNSVLVMVGSMVSFSSFLGAFMCLWANYGVGRGLLLL